MKKTVVPLLFYDILRGLKALCARSYQRSYYLICIYCGFYGPARSVQHGYRKPENPRKNPAKAGTGRDRFEILRLQVFPNPTRRG